MTKSVIAVISDIHANMYALEAFLNYIDTNYKTSMILNLGDFVQIGPHPKEVTEVILKDYRFVNILGNNENQLIELKNSGYRKERLNHQVWTIKQLGEDLLSRIEQLPKTRKLIINDRKVLMVHSRQKDMESDPLLFQGKSLDEFISDYDNDVDLIMFGHIHSQTLINYWKGTPFLNPGLLGCSKESVLSFCLIEEGNDFKNIQFINLKYDNTKLREDYINRSVPKMGLIKIFMGIEY